MKKILENLRENWITYGFETLVVVIGILGAFTLNNWGEAKNDRLKEEQYLNRIKNDLRSDTIYYNRRINEDSIELNGIYTMVHEMYKTQETLEDLEILLGFTTFPTEHLTIQNFTFLEMTNSGNLDLIRNDDLKALLIDYYRIAENSGKHIREINEWSVLRFMDYWGVLHSSKFMYWGKKRIFDEDEMFEFQDWSFINDPSSEEFQKLEGVLDAYHAKLYTIDPYFRNLHKQAKEILSIIDQEIE